MDAIDRDLLPQGLEDRLPRLAARARSITDAMLRVMDAHGYDLVEPPLIEFERSLASRMAGPDTPGSALDSSRRMFRFVDPASLRMLALRSDLTPQVGRIAATRLAGGPRPLRLCYAGQVVTIAGAGGMAGLDPARERLQVGAELIGSDTIAAAGEVVAMAVQVLSAAGATGISVDFTLPDLVDTLAAQALPLPAGAADAVRRELDAKDAGGLVAAGGGAYLPLLYATGPFEAAVARLAAIDAGLSPHGGALTTRIAALRAIAARVGDMARLTLDPAERHGFEYQSWFGFTLYADASRAALGRGGTYRILGQTGCDGEAATGFSLYPDPLIDALGADHAGGREAVFLPLGHDPDAAARLRSAGWRTVAALSEGDGAATLGCSHRLAGQDAVGI